MAITIKNKPGLQLLTRLLCSPAPILFRSTLTRSIETLAFEEIRSPSPKSVPDHSAFFLHGLMGSARNWRSFSRKLASSLSPSADWKMVLVDLRNHGRSADVRGLHPPHDIVNAAHDLANLVNFQGWSWPDVVLGHSFGGKVALQYALSCARGDYGSSAKLPKQLWVLDSVPGIVTPGEHSGEVEKVLEILETLPKLIPSRKWLVNHLKSLGFTTSLSEWMGTNLKKSGEHETWTFDLDAINQMFYSYREMDYWSLLEHPPKGMEIILVRAENSDRWEPDVIQRLESLDSRSVNESEGKFSLKVLPKSGHWVHADNPKGLLDIVTPKMASIN